MASYLDEFIEDSPSRSSYLDDFIESPFPGYGGFAAQPTTPQAPRLGGGFGAPQPDPRRMLEEQVAQAGMPPEPPTETREQRRKKINDLRNRYIKYAAELRDFFEELELDEALDSESIRKEVIYAVGMLEQEKQGQKLAQQQAKDEERRFEKFRKEQMAQEQKAVATAQKQESDFAKLDTKAAVDLQREQIRAQAKAPTAPTKEPSKSVFPEWEQERMAQEFIEQDRQRQFQETIERQVSGITDPVQADMVAEATVKIEALREAIPNMPAGQQMQAKALLAKMIGRRANNQQILTTQEELFWQEATGIATAAGRAFRETVVPTTAGAGAGIAVGKALAAKTHPIVGVVLGFGSAIAASLGTAKAQAGVQKAVLGEEDFARYQQKLTEDRQKYPTAVFAGEQLPSLLVGKVNAKELKSAVTAAKSILQGRSVKGLSNEQVVALYNAAFGGTIGAGQEVARGLKEGDVKWTEVAAAAILNSVINDTRFGAPVKAKVDTLSVTPDAKIDLDKEATKALDAFAGSIKDTEAAAPVVEPTRPVVEPTPDYEARLRAAGYDEADATRAVQELRREGLSEVELDERIKDIEYAESRAKEAAAQRRQEATETARQAREDAEVRRREMGVRGAPEQTVTVGDTTYNLRAGEWYREGSTVPVKSTRVLAKIKEAQDALQVRETTQVPVREGTQDRPPVDEGVRVEAPAVKAEDQVKAQEEVTPPVETAKPLSSFATKQAAETQVKEMLDTIRASKSMMKKTTDAGLTPEDLYEVRKVGNKWGVFVSDKQRAAARGETQTTKPSVKEEVAKPPAEIAVGDEVFNEMGRGGIVRSVDPDGTLQVEQSDGFLQGMILPMKRSDVFVSNKPTQPTKPPEPVAEVGEAGKLVEGAPIIEPPKTAPAEAVQPEREVGLRNALSEEERNEFNLAPPPEKVQKEMDVEWEKSAKKLQDDPQAGKRLTDDLVDNPSRAMNDEESALLLRYKRNLATELDKASEALNNAKTEAEQIDAKARFDEALGEYERVIGAAEAAGTQWGRAGVWRQMVAKDDFSLARMLTKAKSANGGKELPPERVEQITAQSKRIQELEKRVASLEEKKKSGGVDKFIAEETGKVSKKYTQKREELVAKANELGIETTGSNKEIQTRIKKREKAISFLDEMERSARERLSQLQRPTTLGANKPVGMAVEYTIIGAAKIARGSVKFGAWSKDMVGEFGDAIRPYLRQIYERALSMTRRDFNTAAEMRKFGEKISEDISMSDADITRMKPVAKPEPVKKEMLEEPPVDVSRMGKSIKDLARYFVGKGVTDRTELVNKIHEVVVKTDPELTPRDVQDAFSDYGKFRPLSKDEVDVKLRDLRQQLQQVSKLEDMEAGKAPSKTGMERQAPSDEGRRLIQQVNEAKKKGGYDVTDPEKQLATAMQTIKKRLTNQIADLEYQIQSRTKIVKEKRGIEYDPEAKALVARRDELKKQFEDVFGKRELTDEQRVRQAMTAVNKSIEELNRRIQTGDLFPGKKPSKTPETPELAAARAERDALAEQLKELQLIARPKKTPEEISLQAYKTRVKNQIAELERKRAAGDFTTKPKKQMVMDEEATDLYYQLDKAKQEYNKSLIEDRWNNYTKGQKIWEYTKDVSSNLTRALITAIDLPVLRQGGFFFVTRPITSIKAIPSTLKAMVSEKAQFKVMEEIRRRPSYKAMKAAGLEITETTGANLAKQEETFRGRLVEKIPRLLGGGLVRGSQRAYETYMNKIRADVFDSMSKSLSKSTSATPEELKQIAAMINVASGRGDITPKAAQTLAGASNFFFAPRYAISRFQLALGQPLLKGLISGDAKGTWKAKKLIAAEYARYLGGMATFYSMIHLRNQLVDEEDRWGLEFDPRSSEFGKIKIGNTRIDVGSGLSQVITFLTRITTGESKTASGEKVLRDFVRPLNYFREDTDPMQTAKVGFGMSDVQETMTDFLRRKVSPAVSITFNVFNQKRMFEREGEASGYGPKELAQDLVVPLSVRDIYEAMLDQGIPQATAYAMLAFMGLSTQTYETKPPKERKPSGGSSGLGGDLGGSLSGESLGGRL